MSSKAFQFVLFATSIVLCQTFLVNEWDGLQTMVSRINKHKKERDGNSDWIGEEDDSLSTPFDDLTENDLEIEPDSADITKRDLTSSEHIKIRNMKLGLEKDMVHRKNTIKSESDNIAKKSLGNFEMKRRETLVTIPILNSHYEEINCGEKCLKPNNPIEPKRQNYEELLEVLKKQLDVVESFIDFIKNEKTVGRQRKSEFDELLDSIKNKTIAIKTTEATTTPDVKETVMVTLLDESEIRDALKEDPLVKRIIKLAKKKREQYIIDIDQSA